MTQGPAPRRRPDGSLDTAHYMDIGRRHRGVQARRIFAAFRPRGTARHRR